MTADSHLAFLLTILLIVQVNVLDDDPLGGDATSSDAQVDSTNQVIMLYIIT